MSVQSLLLETKREGMENLVKWLELETDFFDAPASTRFHGSYFGGLIEHSLNVYDVLCDMSEAKLQYGFNDLDKNSIAICTLLHDVCKTNFYKESTRNVKNELTGQWEKKPYYEVDDNNFYGHGECSVMLIEKHIKLTDEERYAIRWHMGGFDDCVKAGNANSLSKAFEKYPLALALHIADMIATYSIESIKRG